MNKQREWGDSSLFKMNQAYNPDNLYCSKDSESRDGFLFKFDSTQFKNCNQALRGAIFDIADGVQVEITNGVSMSGATNNSAIEGGFAFLQGHGTMISIKDAITFTGQNAYFGGAFFLVDQSEIELEKMTFEKSDVYDGLIYQDRNTHSTLKNLLFNDNLVEDRAIISTHDYSFFEMSDCDFTNNEAIGDSGIIFQDNSRNNKYYTGFENGLSIFGDRDDHLSTIKNVKIIKTDMFYGGNIIKVVNSNMIIENVTMEDNNIYSKSGGIHMSYSNINLTNSLFDVKNDTD